MYYGELNELYPGERADITIALHRDGTQEVTYLVSPGPGWRNRLRRTVYRARRALRLPEGHARLEMEGYIERESGS